MEPIYCSVPDAGQMLGIRRSTTYRLIGEGKLKTVTIGSRRLVVIESVRVFAASLLKAA